MKVLILSCNTGEGHNSAARAIKEYFESQGVSCDIRDALAFLSEEASRLISKGHVFIYKNAPLLFGKSYQFTEKRPSKEADDSLIYDIMKLGAQNLFTLLRQKEYDTVISVHIFATHMLTRIRKEYNPSIRMYFVATDYCMAPGLEVADVDAAFIPHPLLIDAFAASGIERNRLIPTGIPVHPIFYQHTEKERAKELLGLPTDKRIVLIMGGSMGAGPIKTLTKNLTQRVPEDTLLIVICGNNRRLKKTLEKIEHEGNLRVVGYTKQVCLFMDAAEMLITKPGGLSSTEGATKRLPMIFVNAVPGCESYNLDFFVERGIADSGRTPAELTEKVLTYLAHPEKGEALRQAMAREFPGCAVQAMFEYVSGVKAESLQ
jgi:processive 1,2-diacylglycerol beta-glucosyltransferase